MKAAICCRASLPHAGSSSHNVRAHTRPHQAVLLGGPHDDQLRTAPQRGPQLCIWVSGSGRGVGRITSATWARARASTASVFANWPVARAKSRTRRGCTMTTGRPVVAKARVGARSRPPGASNTMRVGLRACTQATSVSTPLASFATVHRSPEGRTAMSTWALATSIPTKHGTSRIRTPLRPTLPIRAHWHQTTVRAPGVQDVTTHATLRSRWTKATSVYPVRETA